MSLPCCIRLLPVFSPCSVDWSRHSIFQLLSAFLLGLCGPSLCGTGTQEEVVFLWLMTQRGLEQEDWMLSADCEGCRYGWVHKSGLERVFFLLFFFYNPRHVPALWVSLRLERPLCCQLHIEMLNDYKFFNRIYKCRLSRNQNLKLQCNTSIKNILDTSFSVTTKREKRPLK